MIIKLDKKADALYIRIGKGKVHKTIPHKNYLIDVDKKGGVIGIEVLNYSRAAKAEPEFSVSVIGGKSFIHA